MRLCVGSQGTVQGMGRGSAGKYIGKGRQRSNIGENHGRRVFVWGDWQERRLRQLKII